MKYDQIAEAYVLMYESIYQEGPESVATHNGSEYRLDTLFKLSHNKQPVNIETEKLNWVLPYTKTDKHRVDSADLSKPVLVYDDQKYGLSVIDGAHRLVKANLLGKTKLPSIMLSDDDMQKAKIHM